MSLHRHLLGYNIVDDKNCVVLIYMFAGCFNMTNLMQRVGENLQWTIDNLFKSAAFNPASLNPELTCLKECAHTNFFGLQVCQILVYTLQVAVADEGKVCNIVFSLKPTLICTHFV